MPEKKPITCLGLSEHLTMIGFQHVTCCLVCKVSVFTWFSQLVIFLVSWCICLCRFFFFFFSVCHDLSHQHPIHFYFTGLKEL